MLTKLFLLSLITTICVAQNKLQAKCDKGKYVAGLSYKPNNKKKPISVQCKALKTSCPIKCLWATECSKSKVWEPSGQHTFISGLMIHRLSRLRCCRTTGYKMTECKRITRMVNKRNAQFHLKRLKSKNKLNIRDVQIKNHPRRASFVYIKAEVCHRKKQTSCTGAAAAGTPSGGSGGGSGAGGVGAGGGGGGGGVGGSGTAGGGTNAGGIARTVLTTSNGIKAATVATNAPGSVATCPPCSTTCPTNSATACPICSNTACPICSNTACPICSNTTCPICSTATCPTCTCPTTNAATIASTTPTSNPGGDSDTTCEDGLSIGLEPPVCDCAQPKNVKDCQYISQGDYGLTEVGGSYECTCSDGHAPDTGGGTTITSSCADSIWSTVKKCVPVCKEFAEPKNVQNCQHTSQRDDGLINDGGTYTCSCVDGYVTATGKTITSMCTKNEWTSIEACVQVCQKDAQVTNANGCTYTKERVDGFIDEKESYSCTCDDGYASNSGCGSTVTLTCSDSDWSDATCVPVCAKFTKPADTTSADCVYTNQRTDGLVSDLGTYKCSCNEGYHSDITNVKTVTSTCNAGTWSQIEKCVPVCQDFTDTVPANAVNCKNIETHIDGVDEQGIYECNCDVGYASENQDGIIIKSICDNGNWSPLPGCVSVCNHFTTTQDQENAENCGYSNERGDGYIADGEIYSCTCVANYASDTGLNNIISSTCSVKVWTKIATCVPVCQKDAQVTNANGCTYTNERVDGLIDEKESYSCTCDDGYASDSGCDTTVTLTCSDSDWSVATCVPVCAKFTKPADTTSEDCVYTNQRTDGLVSDQGTYQCICSEGYYSDITNAQTITSTCNVGTWSQIEKCVPACKKITTPDTVVLTVEGEIDADTVKNGGKTTITCGGTTVGLFECEGPNWKSTCTDPACYAFYSDVTKGLFFFDQTKRTGAASQPICIDNHCSHLASIHSETENAFAHNLFIDFYGSAAAAPYAVYIGALISNAAITWTDGSAVGYQKWNSPAIPNTFPNGCGVIKRNSRWEDNRCTTTHPTYDILPAMCKIRLDMIAAPNV